MVLLLCYLQRAIYQAHNTKHTHTHTHRKTKVDNYKHKRLDTVIILKRLINYELYHLIFDTCLHFHTGKKIFNSDFDDFKTFWFCN